MNILGIWDGHDAGAALIVDGRLVAAANEERFSRRKLEVRFPEASIATCMAIASLDPSQVDLVAVSPPIPPRPSADWRPGQKSILQRAPPQGRAWCVGGLHPPGQACSHDVRAESAYRRRSAGDESMGIAPARGTNGPPVVGRSPRGSCVCAAYGSGLQSAAVLTIDGVGDGLSATTSLFRDARLTRVRQSAAAHSLGVFFEQVTMLLNMRELEDEGKVMALAEYASPVPDAENPLLPLVTVRTVEFFVR